MTTEFIYHESVQVNQFKWIDSELDLLIWMLTWIDVSETDSKT